MHRLFLETKIHASIWAENMRVLTGRAISHSPGAADTAWRCLSCLPLAVVSDVQAVVGEQNALEKHA
jgi:hypothetical protein